jgi:hypothetical protein
MSDTTYNFQGYPLKLIDNGDGSYSFAIGGSGATGATSANQTNGSQQTKVTDGTNIVNVLKGLDGSAAAQNSQFVAGAYLEKGGLSTSSVTGNDLQAGIDVSNYKWFSVQTFGTWTGTVSVQGSNDNTNWVAVIMADVSSASVATTITSNIIRVGSIGFRYLRVRVTAGGTGTVQGAIQLYTVPPPAVVTSVSAAQSGSWAVGPSTSTGSATGGQAMYVGINSSAATLQGLDSINRSGDSGAGNNAVASGQLLFNGSTYDRVRNNETVSLLTAAARTTTQTSADLVNFNGASFLDVILDTTVASTGSVTLAINGKDPASGKYYPLLAGLAVTTVTTNVYRIGVGLTPVANAAANLPLPRIFQIVVTANNANSQTYSVGYNLTRGQ